MLATGIITVLAFALLMGMMAIGLMFQGKRLSGSCGGNPDSVHCGCSPEKKAVCAEKHGADDGPELPRAIVAGGDDVYPLKPRQS